MSESSAKPEPGRITNELVPLPIFFPESEEACRHTYLTSGPRKGFLKIYERASHGSANAQAVLANAYLNGWVDGHALLNESEYWARQSAEKGNMYGRWVLAWALLENDQYGEGYSVLVDSGSQNFSPALYHLGLMQLSGSCVAKNEKVGIELLEKSARLGHRLAKRTIEQFNLEKKFGLVPLIKTVLLLPISRPANYVFWLLFQKKFTEIDLMYVRSLIVENNIRRKLKGEFIDRSLERQLEHLISRSTS